MNEWGRAALITVGLLCTVAAAYGLGFLLFAIPIDLGSLLSVGLILPIGFVGISMIAYGSRKKDDG